MGERAGGACSSTLMRFPMPTASQKNFVVRLVNMVDGDVSLRRAALLLAPLQIVFRGLDALVPFFFAQWFGRGLSTDIFYIVSALVAFITSLVVSAYQDSAIIPVVAELHRNSPREVSRFARALLGRTLVLAAGILVALWAVGLLSLRLMAPSFASPHWLLLGFSIFAFLLAYRACLCGFMNARGWFVVPPFVTGVGTTVALGVIFLAKEGFGIHLVPWAFALGEASALCLALMDWYRREREWIVPRLDHHPLVSKFGALAGREAIGSTITRVNPIIDQAMAMSSKVIGGGTILKYALDLASVPGSVLQAVFFTPLLAKLSAQAARRDFSQFTRTLRQALLVATVSSGVLAAALCAWREPLCRALFLHGAMDSGAVAEMARVLPYGAIGAVPFAWLLVLARANVALQNQHVMIPLGMLNAASNIAFNFLFLPLLGLRGLALGTTCVHVLVAIGMLIAMRARLRVSLAREGAR
jgi:putative peptidoglycan lipid II flippase